MMGAICDARNFQDDFPENFFGGNEREVKRRGA